MRFDRPFEQYALGERHRSRGRTITEADIVRFAGVSGDFYPLHMDQEYAKRTPFGERIAHGMLTLSAATGLWMMELGVVLAFYGIDSLRFVRPVKIGDTIYVESGLTTVLSFRYDGNVIDYISERTTTNGKHKRCGETGERIDGHRVARVAQHGQRHRGDKAARA
ncbi:MaoC/PaaZ C-terminal domain-containing protein [Geobacillus stearothermophilus]|uniref:MaoC/PaaZ C-terminal domain-containing protein n=1 Tax=Geobacillus TaxID=129337 RepID=UPI000A9FC410|nr:MULTISPECIES: MaoC/PaaZ C-terminal domain-containing protein [Geobacillus]MED5078355.1 MaoC/PaaZ C-terminal domain-containing protein [Geobacillus stearothermophilus]